jgi:RND family efflux transporter MFP subunit
MHIKGIVLIAALAGGGLLAALTSGPQGAAAGKAKPAPLVSVAAVKLLDLPLILTAQGHVTPLNQVEVRPELTAAIRGVHFREGDQVRAGQLLFTLDGSDAAALLERAKAQAAQVKAQLDEAQLGHVRTRRMVDAGYMSPSAIDAQTSKVDGLKAQLAAAQADIANAGLQLDRARILAPVAGRTGAVDVHPGSLAQLGQTAALVTIVQLDPIGVEFELPEQYLGAVRATGAGVALRDAGGAERQGWLTFIDSAVSSASGTIRLKASFANADRALWPGAFVRVALDAGRDRGASVLPPQALLEGPDGRFVYVVDGAGRVAARPVRLLRVRDEGAVVTGVGDGEQVVVEGAQELHPGVLVRTAPAAALLAQARP